jgi:alpha-L-rhamnosidase
MGQWIWKFGEYEIYHNMLLHSRRQEYGYTEPAVWKVYAPEPLIMFRKTVTTEGGLFHVAACGDFSLNIENPNDFIDVTHCYGKKDIELKPGTWTITVRVQNHRTFPCLFIDGVIETDGSWEADDLTLNWAPAGCSRQFDSVRKTPEVFPFRYEEIPYVKKETEGSGILFDFGRETFAKTVLSGLSGSTVKVQFGESREEALDPVWSIIRFDAAPEDGTLQYPPYAFRYIYVSDPGAEIRASYEYLPLEQKGSFRCDEEIINRVWDVAAYTFHLCSREFFLDGIKRDRWVWSADAYQSLFVNHYLFFDPEIEKRTLIALGGKKPFRRHINTIVDYTFFWFISLYEYYRTYGDLQFLEQIAPQMDEVMDFCLSRTDGDGFMRGKQGEWIFIDWAPMDKTGAVCGEQILYAAALQRYADICGLLGRADDRGCRDRADALQKKIFEKFYDPEKKVFIDSFESGKRNVTRQSNILAYLFLPCTDEMKKDIYEKVVLNDAVTQITTPYFKFYENQVHCKAGDAKMLEESMRKYYGSMLATGATTLYEEYDPAMKGAEHYAMYGHPYQKSLCHAWSASPIYLFGAFRMGVQNTGIAYSTFDVRPLLGDMKSFEGTVPVPGGVVRVSVNGQEIRVKSDIPGGTLYIGSEARLLQAGEETIVHIPGKLV